MSDLEGSVFNEDSDDYESQDDESTTEESANAESSEEQSSDNKQEDESKDKSTEGTLTDQEKDKELTDKGTKLDSNPLSALNQQLANERTKIRKYEEVLNNPSLLKGYVAQFDKEDKNEVEAEEPEMRVEDIQTTEDLQKYQKQQDRKVQQKLKELDETITTVKTSQKDTAVAGRIQSDITTVRETYPELDPKSDSYNKALDESIGEIYNMYDFDPQTQSYKGSVSIKEIADKVMKAAGSSKKQGSAEAQTEIRDKRSGRAQSGAVSVTPDESNMTPGQIIAARMKAARGI